MVLFIGHFLLAMNHDPFARPQLLLLFLAFQVLLCFFVEPNLSGGPPVNAKSVVMSLFYSYTDSVTQSASNFGAKLKV